MEIADSALFKKEQTVNDFNIPKEKKSYMGDRFSEKLCLTQELRSMQCTFLSQTRV